MNHSLLLLEDLEPAATAVEAVIGARVHPATITRWTQKGAGPTKVRLEAIKCARRVKTSRPAVRRFLAAVNGISISQG